MYVIIVVDTVTTAKIKSLVNKIVLFSRFNLNLFQCSAEKTGKTLTQNLKFRNPPCLKIQIAITNAKET